MNQSDPHPADAPDPEEGRLIDLLIDGELDSESRRQLLATLDYSDGKGTEIKDAARHSGWRRLALGFVEAQTWRDDFRQLTVTAPPTVEPKRHEVSDPNGWNSKRVLLALAACVVIALGLGIMLGDRFSENSNPVANQPRVKDRNDLQPYTKLNPTERPPTEAPVNEPTTEPQRQAPTEAVAVRGGGELQVLPVAAGSDPWQHVSGSAIPPDVRRALERMGHRVESRRNLVTVPLSNGQEVIVPVEDVEVHYVGLRDYL